MTVAMMDNKVGCLVGWQAGWLVHSNGLHHPRCLLGDWLLCGDMLALLDRLLA